MTAIGLHLLLGALRWVFAAYTVLVVAHFAIQTLFAHMAWRRSRRVGATVDALPAYLPAVDVLVPVYNEEPAALQACADALAGQDYRGRTRVWFVDDGSPNRHELLATYARLQARPGWQVLLARRNAGKRHAQHEAFDLADGELVVTIDSDTEIARDGISVMADAFRDRRVGAVTGNVAVSNDRQNLLTRLIAMRYWIAFNQERGAQGFFGSVLCCSGPFTVYRRAALEPVWEPYVGQTFRGVACTYGDDRHLTNLVLAAGWHTLYEPRAHARTAVPANLRTYLRQQLRWNKSFYRELLWTFPFLLQRPAYLVFDVAVQTLLPLLLTAAVAGTVLSAIVADPDHLLRYAAAITVMAVAHTLYAMYRTRDPRYLLFVGYGFLHAGLLIPLRVRALSTLSDNHWGTRTRRLVTRARAATAEARTSR
jgi:cellulose synthase/poly-beta-1,6-N-acetylglucosamine synthase-like glycosyltransferase